MQGNDETFVNFPQRLQTLLGHALPNLNICTAIYPAFETRGDLGDTVTRFREWLINRVIDIEVAQETPSPTVEPGVKTILVGHSMGGIVNAETVLSIVNDMSTGPLSDGQELDQRATQIMFPSIQGVLAFDTPYLGISPGVVARGMEDQYAASKAWYDNASGLFAASPWGPKANNGVAAEEAAKTLPAASTASPANPAVPAWQRWGKLAAAAGGAAAVAAGIGTAAYVNREQLVSGLTWANSHLEFVGCLARGEELRRRLESLISLKAAHGVGFANLYTALGLGAPNARPASSSSRHSWTSRAIGSDRTFCIIPKGPSKELFHEARNDKAAGEVEAHMWMFSKSVPQKEYVLQC